MRIPHLSKPVFFSRVSSPIQTQKSPSEGHFESLWCTPAPDLGNSFVVPWVFGPFTNFQSHRALQEVLDLRKASACAASFRLRLNSEKLCLGWRLREQLSRTNSTKLSFMREKRFCQPCWHSPAPRSRSRFTHYAPKKGIEISVLSNFPFLYEETKEEHNPYW